MIRIILIAHFALDEWKSDFRENDCCLWFGCICVSGMRNDVEPIDLLRALAGVSNYAAGPSWENSAKRLVDILIAGSRTSAS